MKKHKDGISAKVKDLTVRLRLYGDSIVRVTVFRGTNEPRLKSLSVTKKSAAKGWRARSIRGKAELSTSVLSASIDGQTGAVAFRDAGGEAVLREASNGHVIESARVLHMDTCHVQQKFLWQKGEELYGLGQHQQGIVSYRGRKQRMLQKNMEVAVPVLISTRGYGILWDNASETVFSDTKKPGGFRSEAGEAIDYYFVFGPELDGVIAGLRKLTGAAPMYPKWAYGLFQCKERYRSQEELLDIVRSYRRRKVPVDCIVQDWRYWDPYKWGSHRLDPIRYPDPADMMKTMHGELNCRVMISVWPRFVPGSENFERMYGNEYLYRGFRLHNEGESYYDAFNPEARRMYWNQLNNWLFTKGFDAWWLDATEPEMHPRWPAAKRKKYMTTPHSGPQNLNAYPLMTTQGVYRGQRRHTDEKRVYILTRSAFTGQQRNAATTWSGDINATWEVFRNQIVAGLHFCATGIPYWTTDIGGFFVSYDGGHDNPEYRELFLRWFQYGTFCPIFRVHGTSTPREIWRFGKKGEVHYDTILKFDRLRYRLLPYIYSLAWLVTKNGYTIMRNLAFDFRGDRKAHRIGDQFMFGPALLVNPVTQYRARSREVYLPGGTGWFDFWNGNRLEGGRKIKARAPLDGMPLYVKEGSILPMGPSIQHTGEKPAGPVEIRIYPGADAEFTLYGDEGDNYNYERGARAEIPVTWKDSERKLTIGKRKGDYPGMPEKMTFRPVIVRRGLGAGPETAAKPDAGISYDGTRVSVSLQG
ncbi:MAG: glycoside hydrolase family 31 protein [Kiritimatiellia bacterium]